MVVSTSSHAVTGSHLDLQMHTHTQTRCPASVFLLGYHLMCVLHTRANRQQRAESLLSEMNVECRKWETGSKARWVSDYLAYTAMKWVDLSSLASMFVTSSSSELVILWNYDCFVCVKSSCADQGCFCPVMFSAFCINTLKKTSRTVPWKVKGHFHRRCTYIFEVYSQTLLSNMD